MVYDPARVTVPPGKTRWPLDANVDVTISVDAASKDLHDLKVRDPRLYSQGLRLPTPPKHNPILTSPSHTSIRMAPPDTGRPTLRRNIPRTRAQSDTYTRMNTPVKTAA